MPCMVQQFRPSTGLNVTFRGLLLTKDDNVCEAWREGTELSFEVISDKPSNAHNYVRHGSNGQWNHRNSDITNLFRRMWVERI